MKFNKIILTLLLALGVGYPVISSAQTRFDADSGAVWLGDYLPDHYAEDGVSVGETYVALGTNYGVSIVRDWFTGDGELVAHLPTKDEAKTVILDEPYVYIGGAKGLLVYDISNINSPQLVFESENPSIIEGKFNGFLHVVEYPNQWNIYDISHPSTPEIIGEVDFYSPSPSSISHQDSFLYATASEGNFYIVDIRNPEIPIVSELYYAVSQGGPFRHVTFENQLVRIPYNDQYEEIEVYDISSPFDPELIALPDAGPVIDHIGNIRGYTAVPNNKIYIGSGMRWSIFDFSDPEDPDLVSEGFYELFAEDYIGFGFYGSPQQVITYGGSTIVSMSFDDEGNHEIEYSGPGPRQYYGLYAGASENFLYCFTDNKVYSSRTVACSLAVLDVSSGSPQQVFGDLLGDGTGWRAAGIRDEKVVANWLREGEYRLDFFDLSLPPGEEHVAHIDFPDDDLAPSSSFLGCHRTDSTDYLYGRSGGYNLFLMDITDMSNMQGPQYFELDSIDYVYSVGTFDTLLYVLWTNGELSTYELDGFPISQEPVTTIQTSVTFHPHYIPTDGRYLVVGEQVFSIEDDLLNPEYIATIPNVQNVTFNWFLPNQGFLAGNTADDKVTLYDLTAPPDIYAAATIVDNGENAWVGDTLWSSYWAYRSFRFPALDGIPDDVEDQPQATLPNSVILYSPYPNPFNSATTIRFDLSQAGLVNLSVYDLLGRRIVNLSDQFHQAGRYSYPFDPIGHSSGIYFVRLDAGNLQFVRKIVFVK